MNKLIPKTTIKIINLIISLSILLFLMSKYESQMNNIEIIGIKNTIKNHPK